MLSYFYLCEPEIEEMLANFHAISGLRVGIHDPEMNIIHEYPVKSSEYDRLCFCDKIRFHSPEYTEKCLRCDVAAFNRLRITKKSCIYTCHAGFREALIPVLHDGQILCALMIGQVRTEATDENTFTRIIAHIPPKTMNPAIRRDLHETFSAMPQIDAERFRILAYFLEMCAQNIYDNRYIRVQEKSFAENFKDYIAKNLYNSIHISHAAMALNLSVSHLSRLLAQELGMSFTEYLTSERLKIAKDLLITTNLSVTDIAYLLTYNDPTYFMRVFKKATGMTCTDFRNREK